MFFSKMHPQLTKPILFTTRHHQNNAAAVSLVTMISESIAAGKPSPQEHRGMSTAF